MGWKNFTHILCGGIGLYLLILIGFSIYEWSLKYYVNKAIDKVLPIGEYSDDEAIVAEIKPNEDINDHRYFHPKLENTINIDGFKYRYALSGVRGVYYVRRTDDGSIHQMTIWPQTVLTKDEIYFVRDVDSLIVAMNKAYPYLSNSLNISSPKRMQKRHDELQKSVKDAESIMFGQSHCCFTNEDCTDSFGIPIDIDNYRFIFEGKCGGNKKVISIFPAFYKIKSTVLYLSALCIGFILIIFFIVTLQQSINRHELTKNITRRETKVTNYVYEDSSKTISPSKSHCKYCGKEIDDNSMFCRYCGKKQS